MGHVAGGDNVQRQMRFEQDDPYEPDFLAIPMTPDHTPEVATTDASDKVPLGETKITKFGPADTERLGTIASDADRDKEDQKANNIAGPRPAAEEDENPYASLDPDTMLLIPITNPSAFPIQRLQEVQSQRQPSTHIVNMWCHKTPSGAITQVTADIQDGSINHLFIRDKRWIDSLGLAAPDFDTIRFDATKLRLDETFTIKVFSGQRMQNLDDWVMGELVGARSAYLYWLDERSNADPRGAPYAAEAKAIARKTGRRWPDVMTEIERAWQLERGSTGRECRENRMKYLGEDPTYPAGAEERRVVRSMFG